MESTSLHGGESRSKTGEMKLSSISHLATRIIRHRGGRGLGRRNSRRPKTSEITKWYLFALRQGRLGRLSPEADDKRRSSPQLRAESQNRTLAVRCVTGHSVELSRIDYPINTHTAAFGHGATTDALPYITTSGIAKKWRNRSHLLGISTPVRLESGRRYRRGHGSKGAVLEINVKSARDDGCISRNAPNEVILKVGLVEPYLFHVSNGYVTPILARVKNNIIYSMTSGREDAALGDRMRRSKISSTSAPWSMGKDEVGRIHIDIDGELLIRLEGCIPGPFVEEGKCLANRIRRIKSMRKPPLWPISRLNRAISLSWPHPSPI